MGESHDDDYLTKKMEEMRKKNEEILKRYQEVEQDKMCADQFSNSAKEKRKNVDPEKVVPRTPVIRTPRNRIPSTETQSNNSPKEMDDKRHHRLSESSGPPPDPNYNFLSDRSRKRSDSSSEGNWRDTEKDKVITWGQPSRHYMNYGGSDFKNVKSTMEKQKASYKRNHAGSLQNAGDLTMQMTGRQRIQYEEWKKEREKVDQARIDRQRGSDGAWRREWDSHKHLNKNNGEDEQQEHQTEIPHNKLQGENLPVRSVDSCSNTIDISKTSQIHSTNDDVKRFSGGLFKFRPTDKSSRVISDGDGRLSITLTNNSKPSQEPDNRDAGGLGKSTQRKEIISGPPRTKSSSWTYLVSESSSPPTDSNYSHVPKPLYPGWQTNKGNKNCKDQEASMHNELVNTRNQSESQADLLEKFNLLLTNQVQTIGSATVNEIVGIGVRDCIKKSPKTFGKSGKNVQYDSDIYQSDESPQKTEKIENLRRLKPCVQEGKCKLAGQKIAEGKDDEWEDVSEGEVCDSSSDIYYSDESPKKIDEIEILRSDKPCVEKVGYWSGGLKIAEGGIDKIKVSRSAKPCVQDAKLKLGIKIAKEKDHEWEDVSKEVFVGSGSDICSSDEGSQEIDENEILRSGKPCVKECGYGLEDLKFAQKGIDNRIGILRSDKPCVEKVSCWSAGLKIAEGGIDKIKISGSAKPCVQDAKLKLGIKIAKEKDHEWEDVPKEVFVGSVSDICSSDEGSQEIDEKVGSWLADLKIAEGGIDKIKVPRSAKQCIEDAKLQLAIEMAEEKDDEWEDVSKEVFIGSGSDIYSSDEGSPDIDEDEIFRRW